jgi:hypothetical protein
MATASVTPRYASRPRVEPSGSPQPESHFQGLSRYRRLWLLLLLASAIVLPRSYLIARAHSESFDDEWHLKRGLLFLTGSLADSEILLNDPPLGEGIVALPMLVTNLLEGRRAADDSLYDAPHRAETIAVRVALWNSVLFVGFLGVVFSWCRDVYNERSAWLAVALFLVEPNFAAHIPIAALDVLGVEGIVVAAWLCWRYFDRPSPGRLIAMGFGIAFALMVKHTAVVLPLVVLAIAGLRVVIPQRSAMWDRPIRKDLALDRVRSLALLGVIVPISIWTLSLFDWSPPMNRDAVERQGLLVNGKPASSKEKLRVAVERTLHLDAPWPAGCYLRAFRSGMGHGMAGHLGYLNGVRSDRGFWKYYPIIACYKVPLGVGLILLLSILSLRLTPPRWAEWGLFIPMLAWTLFMLNSKVNIGFRHFLPAYAFMLMLASRSVAARSKAWAILGWAGVVVAGLHSLSYHPDYLSYLNAPRSQAYLKISDSNVDWGQALKQVRQWLDARPKEDRTVSLAYFGNDEGSVAYYLGDRVVNLVEDSPRPAKGLLLISPVCVAGFYDDTDRYAALRSYEPDEVIGNCILVFDLDRLGRGSPFCWPALRPWPPL